MIVNENDMKKNYVRKNRRYIFASIIGGVVLAVIACFIIFTQRCPADIHRKYALMQIGTAVRSYQSSNNGLAPSSIAGDLIPDYLSLNNRLFSFVDSKQIDEIYSLGGDGDIIIYEEDGEKSPCKDWGRYYFYTDGKVYDRQLSSSPLK